jgi:hypothetical protein
MQWTIFALVLFLVIERIYRMSTTDPLSALSNAVQQESTDIAALKAADAKILADVQALLAKAVGAGQTVVSTDELASILSGVQANDASVAGVTSGDAAADATVNPPAPPTT